MSYTQKQLQEKYKLSHQIIENYKSGLSLNKLREKYNIGFDLIKKILGTEFIHNRGSRKKYVDLIISKYKDGKSIKKIVSETGISNITVSKYLKLNNIDLDRYKYDINHSWLDKIDTPEKAYFIGLMFSDGCVYKNCIVINLAICDINILKKINKYIANENIILIRKIYKQNHQDQCKFYFSSKKMYSRLKELGCVERKTFSLELSDHCIQELRLYFKDFVRGYFDGDGCLTNRKTYNKQGIIYFCGTGKFCSQLGEQLKKEIGIYSTIRKKPGVYRLEIERQGDVAKLLNFMYDGANVFLDRKYDKYLKFCANRKLTPVSINEEHLKIPYFPVSLP